MSNSSNQMVDKAELLEKAKAYLRYNLNIIPIFSEDKSPTIPRHLNKGTWGQFIDSPISQEGAEGLFSHPKTSGLAILAGRASKGLEVIDVDTKYDLTGTLWAELKELIEDSFPGLLEKLVIVKTPSGGKHLLYRCSKYEGNLKLAQRLAEGAELERGERVKVLIETRGEGGYIAAAPTPGYELEHGRYEGVPTITPEERDGLLSIARSFHAIPEVAIETKQEKQAKQSYSPSEGELTPWDDYNSRGDVLGLLKSHGWTVKGQRGSRVYLLRPGKDHLFRGQSGNYHTGLNTLRVFSSSTEFDPAKAYSPFQVYTLLECRGDHKVAARRLREEGYGSPLSSSKPLAPTKLETQVITVTKVNRVTSDYEDITQPGQTLKVEDVITAQGQDVVIMTPGGPEATEEVLKAIALLEATGKRIYVDECDIELEGSEMMRSYSYELLLILSKYESHYTLSDLDRDNLLDEVVTLSSKLSALDRELLLKEFITAAGQDLGISYESIATTVERLTSSRAKDAQQQELTKLIAKAGELNSKGSPADALELLESSLKQTSLVTARDLLPPVKSYDEYVNAISHIPVAKKTGYKSLDEFVGFPPGAISLIAGRPSHGKTTLMFNLMLEMAQAYPDERFYFFTYEEPEANIIVKLLNRLVGTSLANHFPHYPELTKLTNYEFLKAYLRRGAQDIQQIEQGKEQLRELLASQRITVIDRNYPVEDLRKVVALICQENPVGAVFIDYIQRLKTAKKTQDKRTEVAHISDVILQTAKEVNIPIVLGAQLNRDAASSKEKEPKLENLKEAGNLEEDANTVLSVYNSSREDEEAGERSSSREVVLKVKALKNREGEPNRYANLWMDKHTGVVSSQAKNVLS